MTESCSSGWVDNILLSTDGSKHSEGAVREAVVLAKKCGGRLTAMTVVETNEEFAAMAPQLVEKAEKQARAVLAAVQDLAKSEGLECNIVIREGEETYLLIADEAEKSKSTMIVMGRRGHTGIKRLMMGSVTSRVIGYAPCDVLVVPSEAKQEFRNIVVATDGSKYSALAAAEAVCLAKRSGGSITVISVIPSEYSADGSIQLTVAQRELIENTAMQEAEKCVRDVKESAQKEGVAAQAFVLSGKPADAIIQTAEEKKADLIVLGSHGRTGVDKLLMGSVAERAIVLAACPVLVVKKK
jgi:nucleotide-binding universal stress UspA family protein